jgi:hypothetical protein
MLEAVDCVSTDGLLAEKGFDEPGLWECLFEDLET